LSVLIFAFGPWDYPAFKPFDLYGFLACAHACLLLGYLSAAFKAPTNCRWSVQPKKLALVAIAVTFLLTFPTSYFRTGQLVPDVLTGIANPGQAYNTSYSFRLESSPVAEYLRVGAGPLIGLCLPLLVVFWRRLGRTLRLLGVTTVGLNLSLFIAMGTNKALADALLIIPTLLLLRYLAGDLQVKWLKKALVTGVVLVAAYLLYQFFSIGMATRSGSMAAYGYIPSARVRANYNHPALSVGDERVRAGVLGTALYLSAGYYGLAMALEQPFVPMYGVGNSRFLTRQTARILDDDSLLYLSFPDRVQQQTGWNAYGLWATIYPWIASDVSFVGVLVVVFLIGRLFAQSWLDSLMLRNPFAVAIFAQFIIMLFYFNANNQCLQDGEGVSTFWVLLILWRCSRERRHSKAGAK